MCDWNWIQSTWFWLKYLEKKKNNNMLVISPDISNRKKLPPQKSSESKFQNSQIFMPIIIQKSKIWRTDQGVPITLRTQIGGWGWVRGQYKGLGGLLHFCHADAKVNRGCYGDAHALRSRAAFFFTAPRMYCKRWVFPENNRARLKQSKTDTFTDTKRERRHQSSPSWTVIIEHGSHTQLKTLNTKHVT